MLRRVSLQIVSDFDTWNHFDIISSLGVLCMFYLYSDLLCICYALALRAQTPRMSGRQKRTRVNMCDDVRMIVRICTAQDTIYETLHTFSITLMHSHFMEITFTFTLKRRHYVSSVGVCAHHELTNFIADTSGAPHTHDRFFALARSRPVHSQRARRAPLLGAKRQSLRACELYSLRLIHWVAPPLTRRICRHRCEEA